MELLNETPDMIIGSGMKVQGDMKYEGLLRVDGTVDGGVVAPSDSKFVLSANASYTGDLLGLAVCYIDGKVVGEINVGALTIGPHAVIYGDITCKSIKIAKGSTLVGMLKVSPHCEVRSNFPESRHIIEGFDKDSDDESILKDKDDKNEDSEDENEIRRMNRQLLVVFEPQVDFFEGGSWESMEAGHIDRSRRAAENIAKFITTNIENIDEIYVTLDTHNRLHIAHSSYWQNVDKEEPVRGTIITIEDVEEGMWTPKNESLKDKSMDFIRAAPRKSIVIHPDHCLIGGQGSAVVASINEALRNWAEARMCNVSYLVRRSAGYGEMTSKMTTGSSQGDAMRFEAVHSSDESQSNAETNHSSPVKHTNSFAAMDHFELNFLSTLKEEDTVHFCGQACSHCVGFSALDALQLTKDACSMSGFSMSNVSVLRDATLLESSQLQSCAVYIPEGSSTADGLLSEDDFWRFIEASGAVVTDVSPAKGDHTTHV